MLDIEKLWLLELLSSRVLFTLLKWWGDLECLPGHQNLQSQEWLLRPDNSSNSRIKDNNNGLSNVSFQWSLPSFSQDQESRHSLAQTQSHWSCHWRKFQSFFWCCMLLRRRTSVRATWVHFFYIRPEDRGGPSLHFCFNHKITTIAVVVR